MGATTRLQVRGNEPVLDAGSALFGAPPQVHRAHGTPLRALATGTSVFFVHRGIEAS